MPKAFVMIDVSTGRENEVQAVIKKLVGIKMIHGVTGGPDLIAFLDAEPYEEFAVVLSNIRQIPGVKDTNSCLVLEE